MMLWSSISVLDRFKSPTKVFVRLVFGTNVIMEPFGVAGAHITPAESGAFPTLLTGF